MKRAFPKSVVMQYANFMPGEWLPHDDRGYLRSVYAHARAWGVGVGGPDLLPFRPAQLSHAYPLIRASARSRADWDRGPGRKFRKSPAGGATDGDRGGIGGLRDRRATREFCLLGDGGTAFLAGRGSVPELGSHGRL